MSLAVIATAAIAPLAATHLVEVVHHGSIFRRLRSWARRNKTDKEKGPVRRWLGELISCPFCLSHWAGAAVVILVVGAVLLSPYVSLPVWWLALVRLANLINDVTKPISRSPAADPEDAIDLNP